MHKDAEKLRKYAPLHEPYSGGDFWKDEGLFIAGTDIKLGIVISDHNGKKCVYSKNDDFFIDFLIIHEGITDILEGQDRWSKERDVSKLFDCSPVVVRTSGRGHDSRHLGSCLPFLEFAELSEYTYRSLNKLALAKGLLNVSGVKSDER